MFSGIIEATAKVVSLEQGDSAARLCVGSDFFSSVASSVEIGDSISVSGVCLTVCEISLSELRFDISSETLRRTTLGDLKPADTVNIERALEVGARNSGHFVLGHVDGVVELLGLSVEGETAAFEVSLLPECRPYVADKGSLSLDGVSLTSCEVSDKSFKVYVVPHTLSYTNFSQLEIGNHLNLEVDCLARYVHKSIMISADG